MINDPSDDDRIDFDDATALALAVSADSGVAPRPEVKQQLMARLSGDASPLARGFSFRLASEDDWLPHAIPGIRLKILALNRERGYATILMDVAPGSTFPAHHHGGAEECYVISGSVVACGKRIHAGDFHHADAGSDHDELWTDEGCRVLLVVDPRDYFPEQLR